MVLDLLVLPGLPIALVTPLLAQQTLLWPGERESNNKTTYTNCALFLHFIIQQ